MKLSAPLKVDLNITSKCNYDCDFCYVPDKQDCGCEMSLADIDKILAQLQNLNVFEIDVSGGEPLTRKDIFKVFELLKKYDFYYTFNTNGSLVTKEIAKEIKKCNFEFVGISIDAADEEIYNLNRRTVKNQQNVINGIKLLLAEGVNVSLGITLTKYNVDNLFETLKLAYDIGVKTVGLQFVCPNNSRAESVMPTYEQWKRCFLELTESKMQGMIPVNINFNTTNESLIPWELYLPLKEENKEYLLRDVWGFNYDEDKVNEESKITCASGKIRCAISSRGDVFGCEMLLPYKELNKGNAIRENFKEIWNKLNSDSNKILYKKQLNGACSKCELKFCGGSCRAAARYFGDINGSDKRCPIVKNGGVMSFKGV